LKLQRNASILSYILSYYEHFVFLANASQDELGTSATKATLNIHEMDGSSMTNLKNQVSFFCSKFIVLIHILGLVNACRF